MGSSGSYDSEITWTLLDPEGNTVMEGQAGTYDNCDDQGGDWNHECDIDHTQYGAETCDVAWGDFGLSCAELEETYSWDCTGCECPGDGDGGDGDGGDGGDCNDQYDLHLVDSYGDGWNGATMEVTSCDNTVLESGITMSSDFEVVDICLEETGGYIITVGGGSYDSEITWTLLDPDGNTVMEGQAGTYDNCDQGGGDPEPQPQPHPDPDSACDETLLEHADSFGDGWNGGYWEIEGTDLTGTLSEGSSGSETVSLEEGFCGTINLVGGSYASEISMDFASITLYAGDSVTFSIIDCVPVVVENCGDDSSGDSGGGGGGGGDCNDQYDLHLVDSWGDGWNGATMEVASCDNTVLESGITMSSDFEVVDICLEETGGYIITVGGGSYDSEITWTLLDPDGNTVMEGQAGTY